MAEKVKRAPFPHDEADFKNDDRVSYDQLTQSHKLEDEAGEEWEWLPKPAKWTRVTDEALVQQQQSVYAVQGVDESEPAVDPRKRKAQADEVNANAKKQKAEKAPPAPKANNAIYVDGVPLDADEDEVYDVFKRCGVIAESAENNKPRIKLYTDDEGNFKGDVLIVFYRPESVNIAMDLFDGADFRLGHKLASGPMRIAPADQSYKSQKEQPLKSEQAKTRGTGANRDRQKVIKKNEEMNRRLADWDDDDDDPSTMKQVSSRWDKVVVLKHMFTLEEIAAGPKDDEVDLEEDIADECKKFGQVNNITIYDKEPDGVVTVRFSDKLAAQEVAKLFNGRMFDGRKVEAYIADGSEKFLKSRKRDDQEDEAERVERFSKALDAGKI